MRFGEETVPAPSADLADPDEPRPRRRAWIGLDALIAVGLVGLAAVPRYALPLDGFFYDDAWQATAAVRGGPADLATLGQTQPGYALLQMVSVRLFGTGDLVLVAPALIAGALGPAALYLLVVRWMGQARAVAAALAVALLASHTHTAFSGRVKTYTTDVLIVLLVVILVDRLGRRRWTPRTAVAWGLASVALAAFSSFGLILTACAGVVLVLHAQGDRAQRVASVAAQAVVSLILFVVSQLSYSGKGVAAWFADRGGMIGHDDLAGLPLRTLQHLHRVTESYTGGSTLLIGVLTAAALLGLLRLAVTGSHQTAGRFLVLVLSVAVAGSVVGVVPLGGEGYHMARAHMWLFPALAIGMASTAEEVAARLPRQLRPVLGVGLLAVSVPVLVTGVQRDIIYPYAAERATNTLLLGGLATDDVVLVSRLEAFSFALSADEPYDLEPHPDRLVGFAPEFDDPRLVVLYRGTTDQELAAAVEGAQRVRHITMRNAEGPDVLEYKRKLDELGFALVLEEQIGGSIVTTYTR